MDRRNFMQTLSVLGLAGGGAAGATEVANPAASQEAPASAKSRANGNGKPNVKLAVVQLDTIACEVNLNVHKLMNWTRNAFENKANFVFLHEGATADYTPEPLQFGRPLDSAEVHGFAMLCKRYKGSEKDKPDLIFWQNNRGNVSDGKPNRRAREMRVPIVASNRCGFSYGYFQRGGSCIVADDGTTVAQANRNGEEEIIYCEYPELIRSPL